MKLFLFFHIYKNIEIGQSQFNNLLLIGNLKIKFKKIDFFISDFINSKKEKYNIIYILSSKYYKLFFEALILFIPNKIKFLS